MQQIEIQYFFPLTEQIDLDLDFTHSEEYDNEKRKQYWNSVWNYDYAATGLTLVSASQEVVQNARF